MRFGVFLCLMVFLSSCISNRKVTLLQKNDLYAKDIPRDSTLRSYHSLDFDYKIQPNDLLSIRFESLTNSEFDFLGGVNKGASEFALTPSNAQIIGELVDEDGKVNFPVIGKVKVSGLSVFAAQDTLQKIANQYLESPVVSVRLLNYRFTILGEVANEGTILLNNNRVSMVEAIGYAGGLGEFADRANIKLLRQVNGMTEVQYINLLDENFINSPYYYIHQNDVLIVPPLRQRAFRKYFGQNLSLVVSTLSLLLLTVNLIK